MEILRRHIEQQIRQLVVVPDGRVVVDGPAGDAGLFGPDSMPWEIHRDFTCMIIGGTAALLLQMLHPLALAGVWDHSSFRTDLQGRLRRTSQFVGGTTYGNTESVDWLFDRVRKVHAQVVGQAADGRPYAASDPELLTWVHVAEVKCFLTSYLRYFNPALPGQEQDRYYSEIAIIAKRLGASEVPASVRQVEEYLQAMRGALVYDARTAEVCRIVCHAPVATWAAVPVSRLLVWAAIDLLPEWAQDMLHLRVPAWRVPLIRSGVHQVAGLFRWSYRRGAYRLAHQRMGLEPLPPTKPGKF